MGYEVGGTDDASAPPRGLVVVPEGTDMRQILELCVEADELARDLYSRFADACPDPDLAATFTVMSAEEDEHVGWWVALVEQWDRGLLPDLFPQTELITEEMAGVLADARSVEPASVEDMSPTAMLEVAAQLEFFLLDPVFGELLELGGPSSAARHREQYEAHLARVITAIERSPDAAGLCSFLARVLSRTWESSLAHSGAAAMHDDLTGMVSRRALMQHMKPWTAWTARYGRPLAIMLVDIDRLAGVNEMYGQLIGDRILAEVGEAIRNSMRESDLVARYGGDEFIALMPEASADDVRLVSERILSLVRTLAVPSESVAKLTVSVSIGAVVVDDPKESTPRPIDEILAAADTALHEAKSAGRDQVAEPLVLSIT
jgi:diguanylate cyclase (GGDEF)-like protein